jgi:2-polyprenyl-3-methyl-5-hydroxy-6-metoxy-1,4-benzoquinol methylase
MDQSGIDLTAHQHALRGLARINWLSRTDAILWPPIVRVARAAAGRAVRVLDLASGGGDVAIALAKKARRAGLDLRIEGCDISPQAVRFAQAQAAEQGLSTRFFTLDVLDEPMPSGYDIMICSLFLHHLDEADAVGFIRQAAQAAGRLLLVNDLVRDPVGYVLAWSACRVVTRSPVVRHDGPISVAGAFSLAEVRMLAQRAGLECVSLTRHWPRRFLLSWSR